MTDTPDRPAVTIPDAVLDDALAAWLRQWGER
jgi:hypothetical protein